MFILVLCGGAARASGTPSLLEALKRLPFSNHGLVGADMNFSMRASPSIYLEPEAPIRAIWAWADGDVTPIHPHEYLWLSKSSAAGTGEVTWIPPPSGMRSAPPLGGLAAGTVELRADGTLHSFTIENNSPAGSAKVSTLDDAALGVWVNDGFLENARLLRTHPPDGLPGVASLDFSGAMPFSRLVPSDPSLPVGLELAVFGRSQWRVGDLAGSAVPGAAFTLTATNPTANALELGFYLLLPLQVQTGVIRSLGTFEPSCSDHSGDCTGCLSAREMRSYWAGPCVYLNASVPALGNVTCQPQATFDPSKFQNVSTVTKCPAPPVPRPPSAIACHAACTANASCSAWSFAFGSCYQHGNFSSVPAARNTPIADAASGTKGSWIRGADPRCLTLSRPGTHAASGNVSICASASVEMLASGDGAVPSGDGAVPRREAPVVSLGTASSPTALWKEFEGVGKLGARFEPSDPYGGAAVKLRVPAGANASLTISLGWFFPHRDFVLKDVGNHYTSLVNDSEQAARTLLEGDEVAADVASWAEVANVLAGRTQGRSSLPTWLGDSLLNSLHHTRSAMWLRDGRWRQWESFACVNVDSVHNDGERHVPYMMLWPESVPSKMRAWASGQTDDGMIQEQLACGCDTGVPAVLDAPCGRVMGDVTSMFIVYLLELWQWTANEDLLVELWPTAKRAAQWQIARAAQFGLPDKLVDTYDGLNLAQYNVSCFSGLFHLLAMRAATELALSPAVDDPGFAAKCSRAFEVGRVAMDELLWNTTGSFYRSYTGADAIMADALYAQVLADSLGLGTLTTDAQVTSHLRAVLRENDTPYGLLCQTGRYPYPGPNPGHNDSDNSVWMMANANWATLSIWRGGDVDEALGVLNTTFSWWRSSLNDLWNVVALHGGLGYGAEGQPLANSHYGYHMVAWHVVFALSGQRYDATNPLGSGNLTFAPKVPIPFELPVLVPGTVARLSGAASGYTLAILSGKPLRLAFVAVAGDSHRPAGLPRVLVPGDSVSWS